MRELAAHRKHLVASTHGHAFSPTAGNVGEHEAVEVVTVGLGAAAVFDHIDLEEAGRWIAPVSKRAHRNAASDGRAHAPCGAWAAGRCASAQWPVCDRWSPR